MPENWLKVITSYHFGEDDLIFLMIIRGIYKK